MPRGAGIKHTAVLAWGIGGALLLSSCSHLMNRFQDQEKARLYLQKAADSYNERDYNKAIESTFEALKYDPSFAAAYNHLALIYMETKRYHKSEEAFKKALDLQSSYPEVHNNLGVLYNREERYGEAIESFQKALSIDTYSTPENAFTNLGFAYYKQGNLSRAKAFHQKALDVAPQFCLASKNMGDVYAKEKNFSKASEYFQRAVTNCPLYQESQYKLGLVMMKLGQKKVAKAQLEKLIQKHKTGPYVERSNEVLKYLH
jgi:type IV pilus assembly protein PilF